MEKKKKTFRSDCLQREPSFHNIPRSCTSQRTSKLTMSDENTPLLAKANGKSARTDGAFGYGRILAGAGVAVVLVCGAALTTTSGRQMAQSTVG